MEGDQPQSEEALLADLEKGLSTQPAPQQAKAAVAAPVQEVEGQQPVAVDPNAPPVAEPMQPQADDTPERIRIGQLEASDRARVVAANELARGEGISFGEAWNRVNGIQPQQAQPVTQEPVVDPRIAINEELGQVQTRLAKAAGEGSYLTPEILADFDRKAELQGQLQTININSELTAREQAQVQSATWEEQWEASVARSEALYNDAKNPDSALCRAVGQELDQISANRKHPLHGNPDLPRLLFTKHAAEMGLAPNKLQAAPKVQTQTRMLPASGQASITPVVQPNAAQKQQQFQERQRAAALAGDDEELAMLAEEELTGKRPAKHAALRLG